MHISSVMLSISFVDLQRCISLQLYIRCTNTWKPTWNLCHGQIAVLLSRSLQARCLRLLWCFRKVQHPFDNADQWGGFTCLWPHILINPYHMLPLVRLCVMANERPHKASPGGLFLPLLNSRVCLIFVQFSFSHSATWGLCAATVFQCEL